ncbi:alkylation response protein AidB-like acyl-CoA dehydrogenase [Amycolatopsis bartoniae]|uniref:Acyl-CoA dehydrogenase n=1 Tax=Amycolatopsis bartoniae TaxID=941986 RepID=A0A8H9MEV5_9PSEU|nr:acyl-CoA dehydrogenase [Amycolatopsis bartoniae]MBB2939019.1 alkylation response protein AidB-like acyl-CoA dehydrogenase [Amycolatopsis bartoniae]TVT04273.1 acyl-CoA dehydrogenase [Amycolatopsis bartoniae]GHF65557.1 acyl-CoA dehydrogenase [Amycolatopsis bartoniae]
MSLHVSEEFDRVSARLDEIGPLLREHAEKGEELGRLTDEVGQALHDSGAFKIGIPRELGGYEFSPRQVIDTIARIAYHDASAGWAFMAVQMVTGSTAAYLGDEAVADLYPDVPGGRYALMAGQGTRLGKAVCAEGGYRISGQWGFASGISLATHVHTAAFCEETGQALIFTFPKEQATLDGNWDVMGLRATNSIDYTCDNLFVPETHVFEMSTMDARHGGAVYRMGLINLAGICHTGWALGVGRRLLDELKALVGRKTGTPGASVDTGQFHAEYAQAEAKLRAAEAWAKQVWADNEATLDAGDLLSTEQETLTRLMLNHTTWSVHEVGLTAYKWGGTTALRRGDLQRYFRDLHAGTQHVTSSPVVLQNCGRWLAGLAPEARWVFLELRG